MLGLSDRSNPRTLFTQEPRIQGPVAAKSGEPQIKFQPGQHYDGPVDTDMKHMLHGRLATRKYYFAESAFIISRLVAIHYHSLGKCPNVIARAKAKLASLLLLDVCSLNDKLHYTATYR